jgi:TPR repeat protein
MPLIKIFFTLTSLFSLLANAGNYEDGEAAYKDKNYALASKKFTLGAINGSTFSFLKLVAMKDGGKGDANDVEILFQQLKIRANNGSPEAQLMLGQAYINGQLIEKNCAEGIKFTKLSASGGYYVAQHNLGGFYLEGNCLPKNYVYGYMWRSLSTAQSGTELDKKILNGYATNKMTRDQVAEAQKIAIACYKNNFKNCD